MTNINIYDDTAKLLEKKAEESDTTIAEVIDVLIDFIDEI